MLKIFLGTIPTPKRFSNIAFYSLIWIWNVYIAIFKEFSLKKTFDEAESTEFSGKVIVKLAQDPNLLSYTGKVVIAADYALSHDIKDIDGRVIPRPTTHF